MSMRALRLRYKQPDWALDGPDDSELVRYCFKSGGGSTTTTTQSAEPWSVQQPFLEEGFKAAESGVLDRPQEYFPGSTVVPFAPETTAALGVQTNRAMQGSPLLGGAQDYTSNVLSGQYLDPSSNPFMSGVSDAVLSQVQPQVASSFANAGRTGGSPLAAEALGRGVSRGMAPYLFGEYGRERGAMESAAGRAQGLAEADYGDIDRLARVGAAQEGKAGEYLQDQISRHNFGQAEPYNRLSQYMGLIQGNYGGTSTGSQTTQSQVNPMMMGLGAATSLAPWLMGK